MTGRERLAAGCVFAGFEGLEPPDPLRRRLADGLGGVVLFARNVADADQAAALTAALRRERPDVVVAIDEEGGDVTRLEAATGSSYPGNLALGAVDDVELTRAVATALGADLRAVGVDVDLAPVADVASNPASAIVGVRSFGADPELVARHVAAFVRGLQEAGVAACAKHFPGHGDVAEDSHVALPAVAGLRPEALHPFRAAIGAGVRAVMSAHLVVRSLDAAPATLSAALLRDVLRGELGFRGMVVTDALEMRAISATVGVGEAAARAVAAGADGVCLGHDLGDEAVGEAIRALAARVPEDRLEEAAGRVRDVARWTRGAAAAPGNRATGLAAARRALRTEGRTALVRPPLVVELAPEPTIAAGAVPASLGARMRAEAVTVTPSDGHGEVLVDERRQLVVTLRDAHLHPWQREAAEALLARAADAVVVETGVPLWRPRGGAGYVATYGAGRVNLDAAAERLLPRR